LNTITVLIKISNSLLFDHFNVKFEGIIPRPFTFPLNVITKKLC